MDSGGANGVKKEVKTEINIMYLIAKFMKNFNYTYEQTIQTNWFTFNDLLRALEVVTSEEDLRGLMIADNHLLVNCKDESKYMKFYKELENKIKGGFNQKKVGNDLERLRRELRGGV